MSMESATMSDEGLAEEKAGWQGTARRRESAGSGSEELDEFGLDLDGSGYEIGQLYYQMLLSLALDREKMPLEIVEDAADDAHGLAVH